MKAFWRAPKALRNFQDVVRVKVYSSVLCQLFSQDSLRSRRLEVAGERENGRARGRHAPHYFQAPATQATHKKIGATKDHLYKLECLLSVFYSDADWTKET